MAMFLAYQLQKLLVFYLRYLDGCAIEIESCHCFWVKKILYCFFSYMCLQSWLTTQLLRSLVERRRMVKSWLKTASGLKRQQFDIQQQALKLTANR
jgi:DNA polymerase elongation subunit (family B)